MLKAEAVVAIYNTYAETETAIKGLQAAGVDMRGISVVGRDYRTDESVVGYYSIGDGWKYWGKLERFWSGIWDVLVGSAFFWVPGIGPILVGGPFASSMVCTLEEAAIHGGLSTLGAALYSAGIPRNSVINYEGALRANKCLLMLHGNMEDASRAKEILRDTETIELAAHKHGVVAMLQTAVAEAVP